VWALGQLAYHEPMDEAPTDFPGHELVHAGLADLLAGRESESALLVAMAAPRLRALGFDVPPGGGAQPSHRLYELLTAKDQGAHSHYNALVGRIVSFARAAERATSS
jgi:hypothetical protein